MLRDSCPTEDDLERYLLGRLGEDQASLLDAHIVSCSRCAARLAQSQEADDLVEAVRTAPRLRGDAAERDMLAGLMVGLKRLRPGEETTVNLPGSTDTTLPPSDASLTGGYEFLAPSPDPTVMGMLGPYRVLEVLGRGGMGMVFRAYDERLRREVALKTIQPRLASRPGVKERFLTEARAAAAVHHDHIVPIYQADEDRGVPFLAMPVLQGESLEERLRRVSGPLPLRTVLRLGREIAEGLAAAHACGLVHRDIKPANIWLERISPITKEPPKPRGADQPVDDGRVVILDFGLARSLAVVGEAEGPQPALAGTPAYMAPEQAGTAAVDHRADLFSLGCVLYRLATGKSPFQRDDLPKTLFALAVEEPPSARELNSDVPVALAGLIQRLLAKRPQDRPASAGEVVDQLAAMETALEPQPSRRWWWIGSAAALVLGAVVAGLIVSANQKGAALPEPVEITFSTDEPDLAIALGQTDRPDIVLHLPKENVKRLEVGDYQIRTKDELPGRRLLPASLRVEPGKPRTVRLQLVGEIRRYQGHTGPVNEVVFMPGKGLLTVSASQDRTVVIWDAAADKVKTAIEELPSSARCVAVSSDGRYVAAGLGHKGADADTAVHVWEVPAGDQAWREVAVLQHPHWVNSIGFLPDGTRLVAADLKGNTWLWDWKKQEHLASLDEPDAGPVRQIVLDSKGDQVLIVRKEQVAIWSLADKKKLDTIQCPMPIHAASFTETTKQVILAAEGGLFVWTKGDKELRRLEGSQGDWQCLAILANGRRLLTGGDDGAIALWDLATGKEIIRFAGHGKSVRGVAFSSDGRHAASASVDHTVALWRLPE